MQLQTVTGYDLAQVSGVQDEEQRAKNGPLWNSELYWANGRQLTVVGDLLRPAGHERRHPVQHVVCEAEVVLQSAHIYN